MNNLVKKKAKGGFSLVEMLVVIAVIGIIAAIAVPNISKINDSAKDAAARRNAQNIASVYASANAAGHSFGTDVDGIIAAIRTGHEIDDETSPFDETFFGVPGLPTDTATLTAIKGYLVYEDNTLKYNGGVTDPNAK
ncbi:MAG: hypothetical protein CMO55_07485 [Verrucomicrobiales bacterium]|nr:hypothetical protein [Verrucomicrobiales bacterium]